VVASRRVRERARGKHLEWTGRQHGGKEGSACTRQRTGEKDRAPHRHKPERDLRCLVVPGPGVGLLPRRVWVWDQQRRGWERDIGAGSPAQCRVLLEVVLLELFHSL